MPAKSGKILDVCLDFFDCFNRLYTVCIGDAEKVLSQGKNALLQLDVDGAMKVKQMFPEALTLFVKPPSIEDLYNRLVNRGTETMDSIKERVAKACYELQFKDEYDVILQNDVLAESIRELAQIFKLEK